jgi:serine/threonine protein kinase
MLLTLLHFSHASLDTSSSSESRQLTGSDLHGSYPITYRDISGLTMLNEIGHGRFSRVRRATLPDGAAVAAKCLLPGQSWRLKREVRFLELVRDRGVPNVVNLIGVYGNERAPIIVTELAYRDDAVLISLDDLKWVMRSLLSTLNETHRLNVFHRDIKWQNLLVSFKNRSLTVIDWGLAEWIMPNRTLSSFVGTKGYKAPELLLGVKQYGPEIDIWATGVVMANLMFGCARFFSGGSEEAVLRKQVLLFGWQRISKLADKYGYKKRIQRVAQRTALEYALPHTRQLITRGALDFLRELLMPERGQRITAAEALVHSFLRSAKGDAAL